MTTACLPVGDRGRRSEGEREGRGRRLSRAEKKSPVVALTPGASSRRESLCPLRLISALLLLMLLFLRRFLYAKEGETDRERVGVREK